LIGANVPRDKVTAVIANTETLCARLEDKMFDTKYPARRENSHSRRR